MAQARDMDKYMRGMVDTCFEEGQYEAGIATLDQLRASGYAPAPIHIRELLYLALYPPLAAQMAAKRAQEDSISASPSKLTSPSKLHAKRSPMIPTPSASEAALNALNKLRLSNAPNAILRALPSYAPGAGAGDAVENDSHVARESHCLLERRSCWELLRDGVVRPRPDAFIQQGTGRRRRQVDEGELELELGLDPAAPVGKNAWPVLELFVGLFEADQRRKADTETPPYSALLLDQIPPPRAGAGPRWDIGAMLDVIFSCFEQMDLQRRSLGRRLVALLVNLLALPDVDANMVIGSISQRIQDVSTLERFLLASPATAAGSSFRCTLSRRILLANASSGTRTRARPQPRAAPRGRRGGSAASAPKPGPADSTTGRPSTDAALPTVEEVAELLARPLPALDQDLVRRAKFELLMAYFSLQQRAAGAQDATGLEPAPSQQPLREVVTSLDFLDGGEVDRHLRITASAVLGITA